MFVNANLAKEKFYRNTLNLFIHEAYHSSVKIVIIQTIWKDMWNLFMKESNRSSALFVITSLQENLF